MKSYMALRSEEMLRNPIGGLGYMDNPISGGEVATVFVVAGGGWIVTDIISRFLETTSSSATAPANTTVLPNAVGILGMPSWTNILVQAGISVAGLGLGGYLGRGGSGGYGVAALNGLGVGAGLHLIGQLFSALMARMAGSKTSPNGTTPTGTMARLYAPEIAAQNAQYVALAAQQALNPPGTVSPGFAGLPGVLGRVGDALINPVNPFGVPTGANGQASFNPAAPFGQPGNVNPANPFGAPNQAMLTSPVAGPAAVGPAAVAAAAVSAAAATGSGSPASYGANGSGSDSSGCGCMGFTPFTMFPD